MAALPVERGPDIEQGQVFRAVLVQRRAELCDILDAQALRLARYERVRDTAGVRRKRHRIREIGAEIREIDRMVHALDVRLMGLLPQRHSV